MNLTKVQRQMTNVTRGGAIYGQSTLLCDQSAMHFKLDYERERNIYCIFRTFVFYLCAAGIFTVPFINTHTRRRHSLRIKSCLCVCVRASARVRPRNQHIGVLKMRTRTYRHCLRSIALRRRARSQCILKNYRRFNLIF